MNEFQRTAEMLERWAADGPEVGGRELLRTGDTHERGPRCGEPGPSYEIEVTRTLAGKVFSFTQAMRSNCDRKPRHAGDHETVRLDGGALTWRQKPRSYREGFWRRLNDAKQECESAAIPLAAEDYDPDAIAVEAQDRAWSDAEAERADEAAASEFARAARLLR